MLFNSIHFLIFLPIVVLLYYSIRYEFRRYLLLAASFYFYCVFSIPLSLLLIWSTLLDYTAARVIGRSNRAGIRKAALVASLVGNLGMLGTFKYLDFFSLSIASVMGVRPWPALNLVLPMGISFYTFQTLAYTIDVYRGELEPRRSILDVALYVSFFPQLVAGPIMRGGDLLPQFLERHEINLERIQSGALLIVWGLFKKILIADPMGRICDPVFGTAAQPTNPQDFSGLALQLATYAFAVQIYCDFSAYSDIAIGTGRILGFRLTQNFDSPYLSTSMREFWRRWHISLSSWLRDYLYIPLGGNRRSPSRTYLNLMITMLLGGLWHGANWTFVIWGAIHGAFLATERFFGIDQRKAEDVGPVEKWIRRLIIFHLVCVAWIFFRAPSASFAVDALARIAMFAAGNDGAVGLAPIFCLIAMVVVQTLKTRYDFGELALRYPMASRWVTYASLLLLFRLLSGTPSPEFIYFQF